MPIQLRRMEGYGNQTVCRKGLMAKKSHAYTSQKQMRKSDGFKISGDRLSPSRRSAAVVRVNPFQDEIVDLFFAELVQYLVAHAGEELQRHVLGAGAFHRLGGLRHAATAVPHRVGTAGPTKSRGTSWGVAR